MAKSYRRPSNTKIPFCSIQKMLLGGALVLFSVLSTLAEGQNISCGNDFKTLEKTLLQTGNNKVELLKAFYPPRQPPATFVTVHYTFLDKNGNITCNKTWFWSSVEFYLIQTPTIFQFMSLFFTITQDRITTANITFPADCKELVSWNENGSCICTSNSLLDILTQQVSTIIICTFYIDRISNVHERQARECLQIAKACA